MNLIAALSLLAAAAPALSQAAPAADPLTVDLVCRGRGEVVRTVPQESRSKEGKPVTRYVTDRRPVFGTIVLHLRPAPAKSTATMPPEMTAAYSDPVKPIIKLAVTPDAVDGKIEFGILYSPKFHVDRTTAMLTLSGSQGNFGGRCAPYEPGERAF